MGQSKGKLKGKTDDEFSKLSPGQQTLLKQIRNFKNDDYNPHSQFILSNGITLHIAHGDICKFHGDAIVNSANEKMLGGGGVDGAIHRASGDELREYIKNNFKTLPNEPYKRCLTGNAIITPGFLINTPFIIHAAGPVYYTTENPDILLESCYKNCLQLAEENNLKCIAFSAISCGAFKYPKDEAMDIAFTVCNKYECKNSSIKHIWFLVMAKGMYEECMEVAKDIFDENNDYDDCKQNVKDTQTKEDVKSKEPKQNLESE